MVQQKIIAELEAIHPKRAELVAILAKLLHLSSRSVYSRLNGKVAFSLEEVQQLVQYFQLNPAEILLPTTVQPSTPLQKFEDFLKQIMEAWIQEAEQLQYRRNAVVYMLTNSLPFSLALEFADLIKYRLYYTAKYSCWSSLSDFQNITLSSEEFEVIDPYCKQLVAIYQQLPTVEIWGPATFHASIKQIDYLYQIGVADIKTNLHLLNQLEKLIHLSESYAKHGSKQKSALAHLQASAPTYTLLRNEIFGVEEYTLFTWRENGQPKLFAYHAIHGTINAAVQKRAIEQCTLLLKETATPVRVLSNDDQASVFRNATTAVLRYKKSLKKVVA